MKFERKDIKLYRNKTEHARLNANGIVDFFDRYEKILMDVFQVEMKFTSYPDHITDKSSSHDRPIGRKGAWTQEEKEDASIPNTYKAYTGQIQGHLVQNNGPYSDDQFEGYDMFWTFSDLSLKFMNGTPNGRDNNGRGEEFSVTVFMFLEDFPIMYREYRKEDQLEKTNKALNGALIAYKKQITGIHTELMKEDQHLHAIGRQIQLAEEVLKELKEKKYKQIAALETIANQTGLPLPKIENIYLNLDEYNKLKKKSKAPDTRLDQEDLNKVFDDVTKIVKRFDEYKDEYACDFL